MVHFYIADISQYLILSISLVLFATMDRSHSVTQFSILDSLLDIGTNLNPIDSLLTIAQSLYLAHLTDMILSCGVDRFLVLCKIHFVDSFKAFENVRAFWLTQMSWYTLGTWFTFRHCYYAVTWFTTLHWHSQCRLVRF